MHAVTGNSGIKVTEEHRAKWAWMVCYNMLVRINNLQYLAPIRLHI